MLRNLSPACSLEKKLSPKLVLFTSICFLTGEGRGLILHAQDKQFKNAYIKKHAAGPFDVSTAAPSRRFILSTHLRKEISKLLPSETGLTQILAHTHTRSHAHTPMGNGFLTRTEHEE